jgi:hypothetical protein
MLEQLDLIPWPALDGYPGGSSSSAEGRLTVTRLAVVLAAVATQPSTSSFDLVPGITIAHADA